MRLSIESLKRVLAGRKDEPKGQRRGPFGPGPAAYAVCGPCTDEAKAVWETMPATMRGPFHPRGWPKRDLGRHLREYHGMGATA